MKAGDYVRTEDGIKKVLKYTYNERYENGHCVWFDNKDCGILFTDEEVNKMKPSSNIIDLIEVGDYVNGVGVIGFEKDNDNNEYLQCGVGDYVVCTYYETSIKSILTKEQFESMEYKVKGVNNMETLTIDYLIKENLELKRKLGEADDAVEYWQLECDKRSKVLDKIKKILKDYGDKEDISGITMYYISGESLIHILELLEEIE